MSRKDIFLLLLSAVVVFVVGMSKGAQVISDANQRDIKNTGYMMLDGKLYKVEQIDKNN